MTQKTKSYLQQMLENHDIQCHGRWDGCLVAFADLATVMQVVVQVVRNTAIQSVESQVLDRSIELIANLEGLDYFHGTSADEPAVMFQNVKFVE